MNEYYFFRTIYKTLRVSQSYKMAMISVNYVYNIQNVISYIHLVVGLSRVFGNSFGGGLRPTINQKPKTFLNVYSKPFLFSQAALDK